MCGNSTSPNDLGKHPTDLGDPAIHACSALCQTCYFGSYIDALCCPACALAMGPNPPHILPSSNLRSCAPSDSLSCRFGNCVHALPFKHHSLLAYLMNHDTRRTWTPRCHNCNA